jgi:murein DD-endopeptidase
MKTSEIKAGIKATTSKKPRSKSLMERAASKGPRKGGPGFLRQPRGGLMDGIVSLVVAVVMISRTPIGGLLWYGAERLRGHDSELPSLTAYFSNGAVAPPTEVELVPAEGAVADNQLPEPWRTAVRTTLAQQLPAALTEQLAARGLPASPETALTELDAQWNLHRDASLVLEVAAIGAEQRERVVARASSAGEENPQSYETYRRYLPGALALEADRFVGGTLALATALDLTWPLAVEHRLTSPFGDRNHPVLGGTRFHEGVDLGVPIGTPVLAAQRATVAVVGESAASGRYVVLDHGYGVRTSYCHLQTTPVEQGATVGRGETFALSGNTGRSTGPHLHYGIRIAGRWVDPERFRR